MTPARTAVVLGIVSALTLPGCSPSAPPAPPVSAAVAEAPEPGRQSCGVISMVLPEGATQFQSGDPEIGLSKVLVSFPNGPTLEVLYIPGQEDIPNYADDASVRAQMERWVESSRASMEADWTPEIVALEGPFVKGYYALVQHDPESKPPNEYVRDLWPKHRYTLRGYFAVGGQVIQMGGSHDDDTGAANEAMLAAIQTAKWAF